MLVHAENLLTREVTHTNSAYLVYVAIGADGKSAAAPPLLLETDEDHALATGGAERQRHRLGH